MLTMLGLQRYKKVLMFATEMGKYGAYQVPRRRTEEVNLNLAITPDSPGR